jgi:hypothetical protein
VPLKSRKRKAASFVSSITVSSTYYLVSRHCYRSREFGS